MIMDPTHPEFSDYINGTKIDEQTLLPNLDQYPYDKNGIEFDSIPSPDINLMSYPFEPTPDPDPEAFDLPITFSPETESLFSSPNFSSDGGSSFQSSGWSPDGGEASSPSNDSDSTDPVLKFISQMLLEENMEDKPFVFEDFLALKATEKSLYDVIGEQYPSSGLDSSRPFVVHETPEAYVSGSGSNYGGNTSSHISTGSSTTTSTGIANVSGTSDAVDHRWIGAAGGLDPSLPQSSFPGDYDFQSNSQSSSLFAVNSSKMVPSIGDGLMGTSASEMVQNIFSDNESVMQFKRGLEEASKFLPSASLPVIDLETNNVGTGQKESAPIVELKQEKIGGESWTNKSRGRKNREREDLYLEEGRSNKQSAVHVEESELTELFDKVMLWTGGKDKALCSGCETEKIEVSKTLQPDSQTSRSNNRKTRGKKQGKEKDTVDLRTLLILCAQAVSINDFRTANELLKQIRQHSSSTGDGSQRVAHFFAKGLEARLAGKGFQIFFDPQNSMRLNLADVLKAYKAHLHSCPFKKLSIVFSNRMICKAAEGATTLHIIDFGVMYGFQWPILIQKLAERPGGPPKLRITGIELPQKGFRPAERIVETGCRLASYCERFRIPFEYNPIAAQNWEDIPIEDLKINPNEVLAVNCLYRFQNLLDETVEANKCPRNAALDLIGKMNPNIFVHTIINGSYNAPFFLTRFREALFHFSSLFDMFDSTLPHESQERMMLEGEFYGREAMNAVACEGLERVGRPETYRQWQFRTIRAGFKPHPLDHEVVELCRHKMKTCYHKDFVIDEDSNWMLQGWKGRIIYASSCWVPA